MRHLGLCPFSEPKVETAPNAAMDAATTAAVASASNLTAHPPPAHTSVVKMKPDTAVRGHPAGGLLVVAVANSVSVASSRISSRSTA